MKRKQELILASLFTLAVAFSSLVTQPRWDDRAIKWDAVSYVNMASDIANGDALSELAPFVYRVGFPALAAFLQPTDPVGAMFLISLVAGPIAVFLMWLWLTKFTMLPGVRLGLVLAFALQFHGPIRFGIFYPTLTYSLFWVFLLAGLILLRSASERPRPTMLLSVGSLFIVFLGTLVRETMMIVPVVMLVMLLSSMNTFRRSLRSGYLVLVLLSVVVSAVAIFLMRVVATQTNDYEFLSIAVYWVSSKSVLELSAGLFLTFGPMLAVLAAGTRETLCFWRSNPEIWALIAVTTVLAVVGGTNTEIFWYWSAPAVLATVGVVLTEKRQVLLRPLMIVALVLAQLVAQRVFWSLPLEIESPELPKVLLSPMGDATYLQLWSNFLAPRTQLEIVLTNVGFVTLYVVASRRLLPSRRVV